MFKQRFTKWGFNHKYKRRTISTSRISNKQKSALRKNSPVNISHPPNLFDAKDLAIPAWLNATHASTPTLKQVGAHWKQTPTIPEPATKSAPAYLAPASFELLRADIDLYFFKSFESSMWVSDGEDMPCRSVNACHDVQSVISRFMNKLFADCNTIAENDQDHTLLEKLKKRDRDASSKLQKVVSAETPGMIADLLQLSIWLISRGQYGLVHTIFHQFAVVSATSGTNSHEIYHRLALQSTVCPQAFEEIAFRAWNFISERFQCALGTLHVTTLRCHLGWVVYFANNSVCDNRICAFKCAHMEASERILRRLLEGTQKARSMKSRQFEMVLQTLFNFLMTRHGYADVGVLGHDMLPSAERLAAEGHGLSILIMTLDFMSEAQVHLHRFNDAEQTLRRLVSISTTWNSDISQTTRPTIKLENCLLRMGKTEEAREIRTRRLLVESGRSGFALI